MVHLLVPELAGMMQTTVFNSQGGLARIAGIDTNYLKIILDQNTNRQ